MSRIGMKRSTMVRVLRTLRDEDTIARADMERAFDLQRGGYLAHFVAPNGQLGFALTPMGEQVAQ